MVALLVIGVLLLAAVPVWIAYCIREDRRKERAARIERMAFLAKYERRLP